MRSTVPTIALSLSFLISLPCARAAAHRDEQPLDPAGIAQLQQRAEHAEAREQAFLFTQLVEIYTDLAGKQIAAGDIDQAGTTMKLLQHFAERIHGGLARDTKKVKNAEMILHQATFRLGQSLRSLSSEDKMSMETTLHQLEKVHDELLAQVFAH